MAAVEMVAAIGFVIDVVVCLVAVVNANVAGNVAIVVSVAVVCNVDVVVDTVEQEIVLPVGTNSVRGEPSTRSILNSMVSD